MQAAVYRILYHSLLSAPSHIHGIANISKVAREYTQKAGITGLLMFDGERFCEYLEGSLGPMQALLARIRTDVRHTQMQVLYESHGPQARLFAQWSMAYVTEESQPLQQIISLTGWAAVEKLLILQHSFDTA